MLRSYAWFIADLVHKRYSVRLRLYSLCVLGDPRAYVHELSYINTAITNQLHRLTSSAG